MLASTRLSGWGGDESSVVGAVVTDPECWIVACDFLAANATSLICPVLNITALPSGERSPPRMGLGLGPELCGGKVVPFCSHACSGCCKLVA